MMKTKKSLPTCVMMWTINDKHIENLDILEEQFEDMRKSGFGGVAAFIRCSRYNWGQPIAREAIKRAKSLCLKHGLELWVSPDPRFIAKQIIQNNNGLQVILYGDQIKAEKIPNAVNVMDNKYNVRCHIPPRAGHMIHEVAIQFSPVNILKVYALPANKTISNEDEIIDITDQSYLFHNARDHYVEAFGKFSPPDDRQWQVVAFFNFQTTHFDFSNADHMAEYLKNLENFLTDVEFANMVFWDEPGYTCQYGALPYSNEIEQIFFQRTGKDLQSNLWKFAIDCNDKSHIETRTNYFQIVQDFLVDAQKQSWEVSRKILGNTTRFGIHDTWHFESGDMCDMNHGSLDLWKLLKSKDGGFVDLGAINYLKDPESPYYANLAALTTICKSLGKFSKNKYAYNNLWTIGDDDGEGWQRTVMEHCVNTMALQAQYWFAHIYGPVGTIGEEAQFLGSPPMPGYPNHSTWECYPEWNKKLNEHFEKIEHKLPESNILLVFPIETMYALANNQADQIAMKIFNLILLLMDNHYQVDVVSPSLFSNGWWNENQFYLDEYIYDAVIFPFPNVLPESVVNIQQNGSKNTLYVYSKPEKTCDNRLFTLEIEHFVKTENDILDWLKENRFLKYVNAPKNCWVTMTKLEKGQVLTLSPSRHCFNFEGTISFNGKSYQLENSSGLVRILFSKDKEGIAY